MSKSGHSPKVTWESRIGVKGESLVRFRLADIAQIAKLEEDVGIDFLGTLLKKEVDGTSLYPDTTFYIQVKSTEHFTSNYSKQIKVSTIEHWLTREAPVFLFIVDMKSEEVYWISIEKMRPYLTGIIKGRKSDSTVSFRVTEKRWIRKENYDAFIDEVEMCKSLLIGKNIINHFRWSPTGSGYIRKSPIPPTDLAEVDNANAWIKNMCVACSRYFFKLFVTGGRKEKEILLKAKEYSEFAWFVDKSHWEVPFTLALVYNELERKEESLDLFDKSIKMMEGDPGWMEHEQGRLILEQVIQLREKVSKDEQLFVEIR